jgi:hypothetical protein
MAPTDKYSLLMRCKGVISNLRAIIRIKSAVIRNYNLYYESLLTVNKKNELEYLAVSTTKNILGFIMQKKSGNWIDIQTLPKWKLRKSPGEI